MEEIDDSLVVGQQWKGDERVILFVKMNNSYLLDEQLVIKIKNLINQIVHHATFLPK